MAISDIPIFAMLRTRMHWHQERQRLLSENVANADTPAFKPRDLAPLNVDANRTALQPLALARTSPFHLVSSTESGAFELDRKGQFEARPSGNSVSLEDEMMKVAENQMDYQAATALYMHGLGLIKTALGTK